MRSPSSLATVTCAHSHSATTELYYMYTRNNPFSLVNYKNEARSNKIIIFQNIISWVFSLYFHMIV